MKDVERRPPISTWLRVRGSCRFSARSFDHLVKALPSTRGSSAMRRFKLQVQTTLDGYMGGPNGEIDWATAPWSSDVNAYVEALMASVDTIVLGRKLAEGFIPAWAARPEGESAAAIDWMNDTPKVVISDS